MPAKVQTFLLIFLLVWIPLSHQSPLQPVRTPCQTSSYTLFYYNPPNTPLHSRYLPLYLDNYSPEFLQMNVTIGGNTTEFFESRYKCPEDCVVFLDMENVEGVMDVFVNIRMNNKNFVQCLFEIEVRKKEVEPIVPNKISVKNGHFGLDGNEWYITASFTSSKAINLFAERESSPNSLGCELTGQMTIDGTWKNFVNANLIQLALSSPQTFAVPYNNTYCDGGVKEFSIAWGNFNLTERNTYNGCGRVVTDIKMSIEAKNATDRMFKMVCPWDALIDCEPSCGLLMNPVFILIIILSIIALFILTIVLILCLSQKAKYEALS